jgi:serine/threonine protein phosphatase PrpC
MGAYLSTPITKKTSISGEGNGITFAASSMQGWRTSMEDAHICEPRFTHNSSLFGVFDGHGGSDVAKFCSENFSQELKTNKNFGLGKIKESLKETFYKMDEILNKKSGKSSLPSYMRGAYTQTQAGATANVILIFDGCIYCANAGDSRTVVWSGDKLVKLSFDHKPTGPGEARRILAAGGVIANGRINNG